jgi:UPF0755 protein
MEWLTGIRNQIKALSKYYIIVAAVFLLCIGAFIPIYVYETHTTPIEYTFSVPKGQSTFATLKLLHANKVLPHSYLVIIGTVLTQGRIKIMAGDYFIPQNSTVPEIMHQLARGQVIQYKLTFAEGLTTHEIVTKIMDTPYLTGEITSTPKEGDLFPSTYHVTSPYNKQALINTLQTKMQEVASAVFQTNTNPFIHSVHELIVLASIIEKEAANHSEMARISGVFVNRLNLKMRLQSDPTTAYGITQGKIKLPRPLTRQDLRHESEHNTYHIAGLPVGPICCPGLAALKAAAHPQKTPELYFILEESGKSHIFSVTYKDHLNHIARIKRKKLLDSKS